MNSDLRVLLVQSKLEWEAPTASLEQLSAHLENTRRGDVDIVVLPEMFTTGFSMKPEQIAEPFSESMNSLQWMRERAAQLNAVVTGSIAVKEGTNYFNRMLWVRPDGTWSKYDKRHLFRMANEHLHYTAGGELVVEQWRGWKIGLQVCYDLRFPVWMRNRLTEKGDVRYDALIFVANWPEVRSGIWSTLLKARAIENQCYVVGVNRVGTDGNGLVYSGNSVSLDARGEVIADCGAHEERVEKAILSSAELADFRQKFPVLYDADAFDI
jgi:omega-amidase